MGLSQIISLLVLKAYADQPVGEVKLVNPFCPQNDPNCSNGGFISIMDRVISGVLSFAVPVVVIMILIGGFQVMTAQGNTEKVGEGKKTITYAIIGFIVILLAKSAVLIVQSIINSPTST